MFFSILMLFSIFNINAQDALLEKSATFMEAGYSISEQDSPDLVLTETKKKRVDGEIVEVTETHRFARFQNVTPEIWNYQFGRQDNEEKAEAEAEKEEIKITSVFQRRYAPNGDMDNGNCHVMADPRTKGVVVVCKKMKTAGNSETRKSFTGTLEEINENTMVFRSRKGAKLEMTLKPVGVSPQDEITADTDFIIPAQDPYSQNLPVLQ